MRQARKETIYNPHERRKRIFCTIASINTLLKRMAFESLTDDKIADLLNCPKRLTNPQVRRKNKDGHEQVNFKAIALDNSGHQFEIYKRQNLRDGMEDDFSCGISWLAPNGETLTLKRYNGPNHDHLNYLEKVRLGYTCHIHLATEKYI